MLYNSSFAQLGLDVFFNYAYHVFFDYTITLFTYFTLGVFFEPVLLQLKTFYFILFSKEVLKRPMIKKIFFETFENKKISKQTTSKKEP